MCTIETCPPLHPTKSKLQGFSNLTDSNFLIYAIKVYDNPSCTNIAEFYEDLARIKYIKRLLRRSKFDGQRVRLILNHIVILYNVFHSEHATRILFFKIEKELWPQLKTFLLFLNFMPERINGIDGQDYYSSDIHVDMEIVDELDKV